MEENRRFHTIVSLSHDLWVSTIPVSKYELIQLIKITYKTYKKEIYKKQLCYILHRLELLLIDLFFFIYLILTFFSGKVFYEDRWRHLLKYSHAHPVPRQRGTKVKSNPWLREERTPGISPAYICIRSELHFRPSSLHCWSRIHYIRRYYSGFRTNSNWFHYFKVSRRILKLNLS